MPTPLTEGGKNLRDQQIAANIDKDVLAILDTRLASPDQLSTLWDTIDPGSRANDGNLASSQALAAASGALGSRHLDSANQRVLFGILKWKIRCKLCRKYKPPNEFGDYVSFYISHMPGGHMRLIGDSCSGCQSGKSIQFETDLTLDLSPGNYTT